MATFRPAAPEIEQQDIDEARAFNAQLEALIATQPPVQSVPPEISRRARREGEGIFPAPVFLEEARDIEIAGRAGATKGRVIPPQRKPVRIYLHIHGGGWTPGGARLPGARLARMLGATRPLAWSPPFINCSATTFLPAVGAAGRRAPDSSPLFPRLNDMPPALFTVGTLDPLIDDTLFMAERWRTAGNHADVMIYPEGVHGFNQYPTALARKANARQLEFLRNAFS